MSRKVKDYLVKIRAHRFKLIHRVEVNTFYKKKKPFYPSGMHMTKNVLMQGNNFLVQLNLTEATHKFY